MNHHQDYLRDELSLAAATAIMESFRGFGERDELWPTVGFACRTHALAQWQVIIRNAFEIAAAKAFVELADRGDDELRRLAQVYWSYRAAADAEAAERTHYVMKDVITMGEVKVARDLIAYLVAQGVVPGKAS